MLCHLYLDPVSLKASKQKVKTGWRTMFVLSGEHRRLLLLDPFTLTTARVFRIILGKGKIIKNNKTVLDYLTKTCNECSRRQIALKKWPRYAITQLMLELLNKEVVSIDQVIPFIDELKLSVSKRRYQVMAKKKAEDSVLDENDFTDVEDVFSEGPGETEVSDEGSEKPKKPRQSRLRFPADGVITLNVSDNPKRAGSKAHGVFALYRDQMTVAEFLEAGGTTGDLNWDANRNFISVSGVEVPAASETVTDDTASDESTADESVAL